MQFSRALSFSQLLGEFCLGELLIPWATFGINASQNIPFLILDVGSKYDGSFHSILMLTMFTN